MDIRVEFGVNTRYLKTPIGQLRFDCEIKLRVGIGQLERFDKILFGELR